MVDSDLGERLTALEARCTALEQANVALTAMLKAPQPLPIQAATATLQPYSPKGPTQKYEVLSSTSTAASAGRWAIRLT